MGANWTSHTILGVKLNRDQCYTMMQKSGCGHDLPDSSYEFCPRCGKQALIDGEEILLECLEDEGDWPNDIDQCTSTDEEDYFIGKIISCRGYCDEKSFASIEHKSLLNFREKLKDVLKSRGLWEPDQYKIWNVLYCSY